MKPFVSALKMFLALALLTGLIYPLSLTLISQLLFPEASNGSLIKREHQILGSKLLAYPTKDDRYFWPRPSVLDEMPSQMSGGSNLGPTSQKLKEKLQMRKQLFGQTAPPELLYASGSGLDPHLSKEGAYYQIPRVAKARAVEEKLLKKKIDTLMEKSFFGPSYVNVNLLNQTLDMDSKR
jgi:K+-transporting ATPase ATPase C chain